MAICLSILYGQQYRKQELACRNTKQRYIPAQHKKGEQPYSRLVGYFRVQSIYKKESSGLRFLVDIQQRFFLRFSLPVTGYLLVVLPETHVPQYQYRHHFLEREWKTEDSYLSIFCYATILNIILQKQPIRCEAENVSVTINNYGSYWQH